MMFHNLKTMVLVSSLAVSACGGTSSLAVSACGGTSSSFVAEEGVGVDSSDVPVIGICEAQLAYGTLGSFCEPEEAVTAFCRGEGLVGQRKCNMDGSGRLPSECPWGEGLNQYTSYLVITTRELARTDGFGALLATHRDSDFVEVEDLMRGFPSPTVPESVRLGIRYFKEKEMPGLKNVLILGKSVPGVVRNDSVLRSSVEVPLWFLATPPKSQYYEALSEFREPSLLPYGRLSEEWPEDFGTRFTVPDEFRADVHVGYLPATGRLICDAAGANCRTDLRVYAAKLAAWDPGDTFVESQFDGAACDPAEGSWGAGKDNDVYGVAQGRVRHHCQAGEENGGDVAALAAADGADAIYLSYHGGPAGVAGAYPYGLTTRFPGVVYAHSCLTGSPDAMAVSLAESQLFSPDGAIAYVGLGRMGSKGTNKDPFSYAARSGARTLGEMMDGFREEQTRNFAGRHTVKDLAGTIVYGDPALPLYKKPAKSVWTLASRANEDGSVDVCVEVRADREQVSLSAGGKEVAQVTLERGHAVVPVTIPSEVSAGREVLSVEECDPSQETCGVAEYAPLSQIDLSCGGITCSPDGTCRLPFSSSYEVTGAVTVEVVVVAFDCEEGSRSDCYLDARDWAERRHVVASEERDFVWFGDEDAPQFRLDGIAHGPNEVVKAVEVRVLNRFGNEVGSCHPRLTAADAEDLGLLW